MGRRRGYGDAGREARGRKVLTKVAALYHREMLADTAGRKVLEAAGFPGASVISDFKIGYANGALLKLVPEGDDLEGALKGLGLLDSEGREVLEGCVVLPWFGEGGECLGMAGVRMETGEEVYLPPVPEGVWNRTAARLNRFIIVTPSILEALRLYAQGYREAIPLWGKDGLTQEHLALMFRSGTKEAVLTFDASGKVVSALRQEGVEVRKVELPSWPWKQEELRVLFPKAERSLTPEGMVERTGAGFTARYQNRCYRVKGVEKGPVKLRASIQAYKAGAEGRFHLDVVEMYSQRGRMQYAKGASALLGEDAEEVLADLGRILPMAEEFTTTVEEGVKGKEMGQEEREEALAFLRDPALLERIEEDFEACGLSGEGANKLTGYLAAVSRKLEEPLAVLIQSRSAAGKSTLQEAILRFVPPEDYVKYTRLTGQALFYADETGLSHKLIAIEEEAGAREAGYSIRNLQSSKVLSIATTEKDQATGKMRTVEYRVKGPVALMLTTTSVDMDYETQNRFLILTIDESRGMTERILARQRDMETLEGLKVRREREGIERRHQNAQRLLRPLAVVNPHAPGLTFPANTLRARRDHRKYLGLIRVIAFLHQHQREVKTYTPEGGGEAVEYVEVEPGDIEKANRLSGEVLGRTLDEVSAPGRALLTEIRRMVGEKAGKGGDPRGEGVPQTPRGVGALHDPRSEGVQEVRFTRRDIRAYTGWSDFQVRTHLGELEELEYVWAVTGRRGKEYVYELAEGEDQSRLGGLVGAGAG